MRRIAWISLGLLGAICVGALCAELVAQQPPQATELPGQIFAVKKTWRIGGEGNWDYLTLDASTAQLFVAHGTAVQVVDVSGGTVVGQVIGMRDAHGIALDPAGQFGYISDGGSNSVKIFDRHSLEVVASIPTGPDPRAIVFEPQSNLVFAICAEPITEVSLPVNGQAGSNAAIAAQRNRSGASGVSGTGSQGSAVGGASGAGSGTSTTRGVRSVVTVIDAQTRTALANLLLPGKLGFAQTDGQGRVYINVTDRNQIAHFDAQTVQSQVTTQLAAIAPPAATPAAAVATSSNRAGSKTPPPAARIAVPQIVSLDWSGPVGAAQSNPNRVQVYRLGAACQDPRGLAVDGRNQRLFAACDNKKLDVLNSDTGDVIATLPIGPGTDAVGYDPNRGLIYTANGGGDGSVSIIRQHVSDSYALIQELPTFQRARTLAVNPTNGEVYLVTNKVGVNLKHAGGVGDLQMGAVEGSFEVLVISSNGD